MHTFLFYFTLFLYFCNLCTKLNFKVLYIFSLIDKSVRLTVSILLLILLSTVMLFKQIIRDFLLNIYDVNSSLIHRLDDIGLRLCWFIESMSVKIINVQSVLTREPDLDTPMIYISNHHNVTDGFALHFIRSYWIAKEDVATEIPIIGELLEILFRNANFILYKRGDPESGKDVKRQIVDTIKNKKRNIVIYPEGKTQRCNKPILPFKKGLFYETFEHSIPIQPVTLKYTRQVGMDTDDVASILSFFDALDLIVVCEMGDVIVKKENESFEQYYDRCQNSIGYGIYSVH